MRNRITPRKRWLIFASLLLPLAVIWAVWQFRYDGADPRLIFWPRPPEPASPAVLDEIVSLDVDVPAAARSARWNSASGTISPSRSTTRR